VIRVACASSERRAAEEFFQLFKVPWRFYDASDVSPGDVLLITNPVAGLDLAPFSLALVFSSARVALDGEFEVDESKPTPGPQPPLYGEVLRDVSRSAEPAAPGLHQSSSRRGMVAAGSVGATRIVRCGYDLFAEVSILLGPGQPAEKAATPTLDLHVELVRRSIVDSGIPVVEIPPLRGRHPFAICLTHDIDFFGIRRHLFDRTFFGFVWRASVGTLWDAIHRRASLRRLARNWLAVASLPLVFLRVLRDPWMPFDSYLAADPAPATYFLIPFRGRPGEKLADRPSQDRRAVKYDVTELGDMLDQLRRSDCEVAVHGIDAWHSERSGRAELARISACTGELRAGIRMHWLYFDDSYGILDSAGFDYDATCGFNDAVGFKAGTSQVFMPLESNRLLELPLHVQDTSLFLSARMRLPDDEAWMRVAEVLAATARNGGVVTLSWHDRSLSPERLWDDFYRRVIDDAKRDNAWFATAQQIVDWFRLRRSIRFDSVDYSGDVMAVSLSGSSDVAEAGFVTRVHVRTADGYQVLDTPWHGERTVEIHVPVQNAVEAM
jgi:hypothetical protein